MAKVKIKSAPAPAAGATEVDVMNLNEELWSYLAEHAPKLIKDATFRQLIIDGQRVPWEVGEVAKFIRAVWRRVAHVRGFNAPGNDALALAVVYEIFTTHAESLQAINYVPQALKYAESKAWFEEFDAGQAVLKPDAPAPVWTETQHSILECLDRNAHTLESLARMVTSPLTGAKMSVEGIRNALKPLREAGAVAHRRGLGFFRPDAPPKR